MRTTGIHVNDIHRQFSPFWKKLASKSSKQKLPQQNSQIPILHYKNVEFIHKNIPINKENVCGNLADILKRGEIIICALKLRNNNFFQMQIKDGYIGEDVRFATELGEALGVKVIYKMVYDTNEDVVNAIHNGEGDVGLAKLSYTPERARKVAYSDPYVISRKVILLNRTSTIGSDNKTLDKILNHPETKIAVMKNTSHESFMKSMFPNALIIVEDEWENGCIQKLTNGEVMAVSRDELRINTLINEHPTILLSFMPLVLKETIDSISAITSTKENSLVSYINKFLENDYKVLTSKEVLNIYKDYIK